MRRGSFNGAATLQLRKHGTLLTAPYNATSASMGPQLCSCGNGLYWRSDPRTSARFNGAATLQLRKPGHEAVRLRSRWLGFNGAATLQLRKHQPLVTYDPARLALQWGRNFAVAETGKSMSSSRKCTNPSFNGAATLQLRKLQNT